MLEHFQSELSQAVLQAILYSDVFDYPLTAPQVYHYLPGILTSYDDVSQVLNADPRFSKKGKYYTLVGREGIVSIHEQREVHSKQLLPFALKYGHLIGCLPFIRMVALTGSLAVMNVSRNADFDYMLVTQPGRLWTARAFVLLFGRFTNFFGHTICPNLIVSENSLVWHQHDLYSAHELCQMIPISGGDVYHKLMKLNDWIHDFLPNTHMESSSKLLEKFSKLQKFLEFLLGGRLGDLFDHWEMNRKVARFSRQAGFGEETIFNSDMCQGNFEHHRKGTEEELEQRISKYKDEGIRVREA